MKNQLKTIALLALLTAVVLWIGSFWGKQGVYIAVFFALIMNFGSYWFSDKIILKIYKAKEVQEKDNRELYQMVRRVADLAKLPMPKIYFIPSEQPNAFATGRNPKHSAVAYTSGILKLLDKKELEGVTAHELAHIKNRDILITTVAATIAGIISYIASMAQWAAIFGMGGRDDDRGGLLQLLIMIILAPLIAGILQMAISRSREFQADKTGAHFVKSGSGLASALKKLERGSASIPMRMGNEATSSLFIVNPLRGKSMWKLFFTHPPTSERVSKLESMRF